MDTKPKWWEWLAVLGLGLLLVTCVQAVQGG